MNNSNYALIFWLKIAIFLLAFVGIFYMTREFHSDLNPEDGLLTTLGTAFSENEAPQEKISLWNFFTSQEPTRTTYVTSKTIDLENMTIWLNDTSIAMIEVALGASALASLIYLLAGVGIVYEAIRKVMGVCMAAIAIFSVMFIILLPLIALALFPFFIAWSICTILLPISLPVELTVYLILGIMKNVKAYQKKKLERANTAPLLQKEAKSKPQPKEAPAAVTATAPAVVTPTAPIVYSSDNCSVVPAEEENYDEYDDDDDDDYESEQERRFRNGESPFYIDDEGTLHLRYNYKGSLSEMPDKVSEIIQNGLDQTAEKLGYTDKTKVIKYVADKDGNVMKYFNFIN